MTKKTIRIKLTDFINTPQEQEIIDIINNIQSYAGVQILLWYNESETSNSLINEFRLNNKMILSKNNIIISNCYNSYDFIWYDIVNINITSKNYKFISYYNTTQGIIQGLISALNYIKFSNKK